MSRKGDGEFIYVLEDGKLRASPAYIHFPKKWVAKTRWQKFKVWLWGTFGYDYYESTSVTEKKVNGNE